MSYRSGWRRMSGRRREAKRARCKRAPLCNHRSPKMEGKGGPQHGPTKLFFDYRQNSPWTDKRITATAKLLFSQPLDLHLNRQTGQCNPRQTTLSRELGMPLRTVEARFGHPETGHVIHPNHQGAKTGAATRFSRPGQSGGQHPAGMAGTDPPKWRVGNFLSLYMNLT